MPAELEDLLVACGAGDKQALAAIYRATSPQLFGLALRILKRRDWAEEALQECFVTVWQRAADYRRDLGPATPWLTVILRNKCLDRLRRERRLQPLDDRSHAELADDAPSPFDSAATVGDARRLKECLDQLDSQQRQAIMLAYYDGLTHEDLSAHLKSPLGTIKSWIRRGLLRLKGCLEP